MQSLVDTRNEVEKWTDAPVEFHFATILSPWIRRALVAGGFGVGTPRIDLPKEIAAVVPYRGINFSKAALEKPDDIEEQQINDSSLNSSSSSVASAPITLEDTPFIHLDLVQAVRAAERSALRNNSDQISLSESERSALKS